MVRAVLASAIVLIHFAVLFSAPIPKSIKNRRVPNLTGTQWLSEDQADLGQILYTFHDDGKISYTYQAGRGTCYTDGSWKQEDEKLYFECNNKYVEFNGIYKDGQLEMSALNVVGRAWTVTLKAAALEKESRP